MDGSTRSIILTCECGWRQQITWLATHSDKNVVMEAALQHVREAKKQFASGGRVKTPDETLAEAAAEYTRIVELKDYDEPVMLLATVDELSARQLAFGQSIVRYTGYVEYGHPSCISTRLTPSGKRFAR